MSSDQAVYSFDARCKDCRRLLGHIETPREHTGCGVVFVTRCRTSGCRDRDIAIRFDTSITADARTQGY